MAHTVSVQKIEAWGGLKAVIFDFTGHDDYDKTGGGDPISAYELGLGEIMCIPSTTASGYLFEFIHSTGRMKTYYATNPTAHAHDLVFKANAAANAVTMAANSLRNASAGDLTVAGAGADGGIANTTPADGPGAEVEDTKDLSGVTVRMIAFGY